MLTDDSQPNVSWLLLVTATDYIGVLLKAVLIIL